MERYLLHSRIRHVNDESERLGTVQRRRVWFVHLYRISYPMSVKSSVTLGYPEGLPCKEFIP